MKKIVLFLLIISLFSCQNQSNISINNLNFFLNSLENEASQFLNKTIYNAFLNNHNNYEYIYIIGLLNDFGQFYNSNEKSIFISILYLSLLFKTKLPSKSILNVRFFTLPYFHSFHSNFRDKERASESVKISGIDRKVLLTLTLSLNLTLTRFPSPFLVPKIGVEEWKSEKTYFKFQTVYKKQFKSGFKPLLKTYFKRSICEHNRLFNRTVRNKLDYSRTLVYCNQFFKKDSCCNLKPVS